MARYGELTAVSAFFQNSLTVVVRNQPAPAEPGGMSQHSLMKLKMWGRVAKDRIYFMPIQPHLIGTTACLPLQNNSIRSCAQSI